MCAPSLRGAIGLHEGLSNRIITHACFHQCEGTDHRDWNIFRLVVLVMADELHTVFPFGFMDVFYRHELVPIDIGRYKVHFTPENPVLHVVYLLVKDNIAAFE